MEKPTKIIISNESSLYERVQAAENYLFFEADKESIDNGEYSSSCYSYYEVMNAVRVALGCHPNEVIEPHTT